MTTGEEIIAAIIKGGLCRVDSPNPGVIVWSSGAAEQIDALIQASRRPRCIDCGRLEDLSIKQRNEIDALRDAIGSLKDFLHGERRDYEQIAAIINGALRVTTSGIGTQAP